jgi:hypothetical protein
MDVNIKKNIFSSNLGKKFLALVFSVGKRGGKPLNKA